MFRSLPIGLALLLSCGGTPSPPKETDFSDVAESGERIDFLEKTTIGVPPSDPPPWITNVAVVDLDQDGLLDVVFCDATLNQIGWIRQAPAGTFSESTLSALVVAPVERHLRGQAERQHATGRIVELVLQLERAVEVFPRLVAPTLKRRQLAECAVRRGEPAH